MIKRCRKFLKIKIINKIKPASQQVFIFQYNNFSIRFFQKLFEVTGLLNIFKLNHFQILKLKKTLQSRGFVIREQTLERKIRIFHYKILNSI